ncbi:MAG: CPBP family intramembrane metalloprotease [Clostridiales bacterium]|nr:CPBP family intramembrane metalloprotease [Clostridiales bacterium]
MIHLSASEPLVLAKSESRGHAWWAELLIFVLVFLIASTVMGFPVGIATSVWIFTSDTFANIVAQFSLADTADLSQSIPQITSALFASMPAWLTLVSLFADALTIAVCLVYCRVIEKRSIRSVGFTRHGFAKEYALGFLIGAGLLAAAFAISALTGSVKLTGFNTAVAFPKLLGMLILFLLGYMIQGMAEEVLCRGYFMLSFARKSPVWAAILISSLIFSLLHLANSGVSFLALFNIFLYGIVMGVCILRRGSIWMAGAIHSAWNFTQGNLLGMQVSGSVTKITLFTSVQTSSASIWNGGAFGPEGGLAVTIVLVFALATFLFLPVRKKESV